MRPVERSRVMEMEGRKVLRVGEKRRVVWMVMREGILISEDGSGRKKGL